MRQHMVLIAIGASIILIMTLFIALVSWAVTLSNIRYDRVRADCLNRGYSFISHGGDIEHSDCIPPNGVRPQ